MPDRHIRNRLSCSLGDQDHCMVIKHCIQSDITPYLADYTRLVMRQLKQLCTFPFLIVYACLIPFMCVYDSVKAVNYEKC